MTKKSQAAHQRKLEKKSRKLYRVVDLFVEKLKAVTAAQVQEVAKKYFVEDQLTIAYLDPQPLADKRPAAPPAGLRHGQ